MLSKCREIQSGWTSDSASAAAVRGKAIAVSLIGASPPDPLVTTKYESSGAMSAA